MPMVTCRETRVAGPRGVRGAGGQVHAEPGLEQHLAATSPSSPGAGWTSHSFEPWVWKTKTSWVSLCTAKPCDPGGVR